MTQAPIEPSVTLDGDLALPEPADRIDPAGKNRSTSAPPLRHSPAALALLLLALVLIGGITPLAARLALHEMPALTLAWIRFGSASVPLWLTLLARGTRLPWRAAPAWLWLLMAVLLVPVNQVGFLWGIKLSSGSHAGVIYALMPVLVFWFSVAAGRRPFDRWMLLAALLAFAGAASVALPDLLAAADPRSAGSAHAMRTFGGVLLLLVAVCAWAGFVVLSEPVIQKVGALPVLTAVLSLGALLHTPLMLLDLKELQVESITWRGAGGLAWLTLITIYVGYLLFYIVLARFEATRALIVINAQFMVTVLCEWGWYGERPAGWFLIGCGLILAAIAMDWRRPRPSASSLLNLRV